MRTCPGKSYLVPTSFNCSWLFVSYYGSWLLQDEQPLLLPQDYSAWPRLKATEPANFGLKPLKVDTKINFFFFGVLSGTLSSQ